VYPTDEAKFRDAVGQVPHDYVMFVGDSSDYWGVGNYNAYVGVPANDEVFDFDYLVVHEFGHLMGLNEEYSVGETELWFGDGIDEPWSQNMTFQDSYRAIKWKQLFDANTPIPTPPDDWPSTGVAAYAGGYGGMDPRTLVPAPEGECVMSSGLGYCNVCSRAIAAKLEFDLAP
jgi:hypothetical protein